MKTLAGGRVYELSIHLVLGTKYSEKVINKPMMTRLKQIFESTGAKWGCQLVEFNGEPDPVHMLIDINPKALA